MLEGEKKDEQNSLFKMLSKRNRTNKKLVEKIFKEGRFINSPNLTLKFIKENTIVPQISFITPKLVSKKAVDRNLLRRRGYFILRKYLTQFPPGFVGVFIFSKKSMNIFGGKKNKSRNPIKNLENEIENIFNKIH